MLYFHQYLCLNFTCMVPHVLTTHIFTQYVHNVASTDSSSETQLCQEAEDHHHTSCDTCYFYCATDDNGKWRDVKTNDIKSIKLIVKV